MEARGEGAEIDRNSDNTTDYREVRRHKYSTTARVEGLSARCEERLHTVINTPATSGLASAFAAIQRRYGSPAGRRPLRTDSAVIRHLCIFYDGFTMLAMEFGACRARSTRPSPLLALPRDNQVDGAAKSPHASLRRKLPVDVERNCIERCYLDTNGFDGWLHRRGEREDPIRRPCMIQRHLDARSVNLPTANPEERCDVPVDGRIWNMV
ncbi:hypothetical protein BCR34DRAFT_585301 [Clohesyomyces aquaticus]|uniref:Uncharacterized protein n=1 Tax=Clohesyomyces aquaticus TaxID=1231657 RepID=A0A1Y1ZY78_9PLEO|nr:hypothetical protein BCR34DRAFT_585301 [Clohesyomyces aquaticus]